MAKQIEPSDMPPLTEDMHNRLRSIEGCLRAELSSCCSSYSLIDPDAAFEYARTYATKFYDCYFGFYSNIPDLAYGPHWRPASERFAFQRVLRCLENHSAVRSHFQNNSHLVARIRKTIEEHAERTAAPKVIKMATEPENTTEPSFGPELRRLLNDARSRPEDIAEEVGIQPRNVYRHLSGENSPSLVNVARYEKALSKRLGYSVKLPTPAKRHNASKTSAKRQ